MNRIQKAIEDKGGNVLNVYFTAGYPELNSTVTIIEDLSKCGVDLVELGMPYSDPLADGTTIQQSSEQALKNGLNLKILFEQVTQARMKTDVPIIMMGYYNQLLQYGIERFIKQAVDCGVDGMIIPDLPMNVYEREYKDLFESCGMGISFLITPLTSDERIRQADRLSTAFIYMVSQSSITGSSGDISAEQKTYFERINAMDLSTPRLIGFGIHDKTTYETACQYSHGAIIGSAYIRALTANISTEEFIRKIRD